MRLFARAFAAFTLTASIASCTSLNARTAHDQTFDFSGYDTFSWISDKPMIVAGPEVSPRAQERIQKAITETLAPKGIHFVADPASADFVIAFTVGTRQQVRVNSTSAYPYPVGYVGPRSWGEPYYNDVDVQDYSQGRLAIDIFDAKTKRPVWTGVATKSISGADQAHPLELVNAAVKAILVDFPPAPTR